MYTVDLPMDVKSCKVDVLLGEWANTDWRAIRHTKGHDGDKVFPNDYTNTDNITRNNQEKINSKHAHKQWHH